MAPRILLVEDDPVSREVIAALLASRDHEVDVADDGFGALRMAQDTRYDLVFIDYHLPEMDGYALARLMRSLGEKTNSTMKMVAITADQFGLAARRGVDAIFDRTVAKPIAPDLLFALVEEFLGPVAPLDDIESFLTPQPVEDLPSPGLVLWRARGLTVLPRAAVFPSPTPSEKAALEHCFQLVASDEADCFILLRSDGLAAVEAMRTEGSAYLKPLFVLEATLSPLADALFEAASAESWSATARLLKDFDTRRHMLRRDAISTTECEVRLAAYLFAADRGLELIRGPNGQTDVPYTAGFPAKTIIAAVKQLAGRGLVAVKPGVASPDGLPRLTISLTTKCITSLSKDGVAVGSSAFAHLT